MTPRMWILTLKRVSTMLALVGKQSVCVSDHFGRKELTMVPLVAVFRASLGCFVLAFALVAFCFGCWRIRRRCFVAVARVEAKLSLQFLDQGHQCRVLFAEFGVLSFKLGDALFHTLIVGAQPTAVKRSLHLPPEPLLVRCRPFTPLSRRPTMLSWYSSLHASWGELSNLSQQCSHCDDVAQRSSAQYGSGPSTSHGVRRRLWLRP